MFKNMPKCCPECCPELVFLKKYNVEGNELQFEVYPTL